MDILMILLIIFGGALLLLCLVCFFIGMAKLNAMTREAIYKYEEKIKGA